ncbi:RNHCP domain-containing protein [Agromyces sp. NPDC056965]|uniref:RNHCP domain-containing protein n=1 Tax=Agromyces sp. NPDC056965 TaxID=3345983 RepID=UPI0036333E74
MKLIALQEGRAFRCLGCKLDISWDAPGTTNRNHCPTCLTSKHVDDRMPGDRASACLGRMDAIAIASRDDGEWLVVHECRACLHLSTNRVAGDDNPLALLRIAVSGLPTASIAASLVGGAYTEKDKR